MTKFENRTNIGRPIAALCDILGLDYGKLSTLYITPTELTATSYKPNENGAAHIDPNTNEAVMETRTYEIRT